jgi:hypothetical protein
VRDGAGVADGAGCAAVAGAAGVDQAADGADDGGAAVGRVVAHPPATSAGTSSNRTGREGPYPISRGDTHPS